MKLPTVVPRYVSHERRNAARCLVLSLGGGNETAEFITLLGSGAVAWPLAAIAQQPAMPVVGYLEAGLPEAMAYRLGAFRNGLSETGYVEGHNVAIEYRWAQDQYDRLPELAADLVRRGVAVIATPGSAQGSLAAQAATTTIPIVFSTGVDPVKAGLVASLSRPGGNITGISSMTGQLGAKQLGLLHELLSGATRFAVLANPNNAMTEAVIEDLRTAALAIGGQIDVFNAGTNRDIDTVFASLVQKRVDALLVTPDPMIGDDGNRGAQPRWPHVVANVVADHSVLPVPDASAFEPDALASEDITLAGADGSGEASACKNASAGSPQT